MSARSRGRGGLAGWFAIARAACALLVSALAIGCAFTGCNTYDEVPSLLPPPEEICPPASFFFCRCEGDVPGTKQCSADGSAFGECVCASSSCEPGEEIACGCGDDGAATAVCDENGAIGPCGCETPVSAADEDCPGKPLAVPRSATVKIAGNTAKARADRIADCGGDGPEQVFQLVPGANGTLRLDVRSIAPLDAVVSVYGAPCGETTIACLDDAAPGGTESVDVPVSAGAPVFVSVDSYDSGGSFVLAATLIADGPVGDLCPGAELSLGVGQSLVVDDTTSDLGDDFAGSGACAQGAGAPDRVYVVTATKAGVLRAKLLPGGDRALLLYASETCGGDASLGCARAGGTTAAEMSLPLATGESVALVVDGEEEVGDTFSLELALDAK